MTLTPAFLDEVRARTTLSALVARSVKLTRAGNEWKACCPFHQEKSPSFYVNDSKGFYHCFGCGAHGDAIRWLTEQAGLGFVDAVKELAEAGGLEMPAPDPALARRIEAQAGLHDVMQAAADWYRAQYAEHRPARDYAGKRGLTPATVDMFGIGYAPDGRTRLKEALKQYDERLLVEAGLLIAVDGKAPYDRFRDRLMIPIRDPRGRVIAFGGRTLGEGEPKYLNSPETPLFDKGRTLFNLDKAALAARKAGRLIVVEGYLDVIALTQAKLFDTVAPLGTAVTESQLELLWRTFEVPTIFFDGDGAGRKAAARTATRALPLLRSGRSLRIAHAPEGSDPFDVARDGGVSAVEELLDKADPLIRTLYQFEVGQIDPSSTDDRIRLRSALEQYANSCEDSIVRDEYARSFRQMFFEDFGWKKVQREAIGNSILRTTPRIRPQLYKAYGRSLLYGLTRFPSVANDNLEDLSFIRFSDGQLTRWQDQIGTAVSANPQLVEDGIGAIITGDWLPEVRPMVRQDLQLDLRFPYSRQGVERAYAQDRLAEMLRLMRTEVDLDDRLTELDRAAVADTGLSRYHQIEASRIPLRAAKRTLYERAVALDDGLDVGADAPKLGHGGF